MDVLKRYEEIKKQGEELNSMYGALMNGGTNLRVKLLVDIEPEKKVSFDEDNSLTDSFGLSASGLLNSIYMRQNKLNSTKEICIPISEDLFSKLLDYLDQTLKYDFECLKKKLLKELGAGNETA